MSIFQDPAYLVSDQYKDAVNLEARIRLHERYSTNPYGWFRWVFDQLDLPRKAIILEIGCGSGALWAENLTRISADWHIILSDFSPGMVQSCQQKLPSPLSKFYFEASNAQTIPFPDETFDAAIANHMLYHIRDRQRALGEIARVLIPGGRLYAATNGENHLLELDSFIDQHYRTNNFGILPGKPSRDFTLENGLVQLTPWFGRIEIRRYEDSLQVTDAEPLVAYIQSMTLRSRNPTDETTASIIYGVINDQISLRGSITIQKSSGLFIAEKCRGADE